MAANQIEQNDAPITDLSPTCMESVNRFSKLPVVDSTIKTATSLYEKVKDFNSITQWTLSTAESTVNKAVEVGKPIATPVIKNFEGPIKRVDNVLCSGLDYIENKVPAVKLPANEIILQIYNSTKGYVETTVTPAVESVKAYAEPAIKTAKSYAEPAMKTAKDIIEPAYKNTVEPAMEIARNIVEPLVQPALDKANAIKDNVFHKVDEYLHYGHHNHDGKVEECEECKEIRRKADEQRQNQGSPHH